MENQNQKNNTDEIVKEIVANNDELTIAKTALGLTEKALDTLRGTESLVYAEGHLSGLLHAEQILNQCAGIKEAKKMLNFIAGEVTKNINKAYYEPTQQQGEENENSSNDQSSSDATSASSDSGRPEGATVSPIGGKQRKGRAKAASKLQ